MSLLTVSSTLSPGRPGPVGGQMGSVCGKPLLAACRSYQRVDLRFPVEDGSRLIHSGGTSRSWLISRHLRPGGFRRPVMHHVFRRRTGRGAEVREVRYDHDDLAGA